MTYSSLFYSLCIYTISLNGIISLRVKDTTSALTVLVNWTFEILVL